MKYYAVTEDPRELFHYGVKGMKWGQHLFGDDLRPKSPAFKRAASKLRSFREKSKANKIAKEQNNYMKSVQKSQNKLNLIENLNKYDQEKAYYKQLTREQKSLNKQNKYANKIASLEPKRSAVVAKQSYKQAKRSTKAEKHMDKILQEAREGRLRYGNLSEEQIGRIQERLNMENQARRLGGTEKASWRQQKKEARRAGKLQGITKGTAAAMEEIARAGAIFGVQHALDRLKKRSAAKQQGKEERIKNRAKNKKTTKDIKQDIKQESMELRVKEGQGIIRRNLPFSNTAKASALRLKEAKQKKLDEEKRLRLEEDNEKHDRERERRRLDKLDDEWHEYVDRYGLDDKPISNDEKRKIIDKYRNFENALNTIAFNSFTSTSKGKGAQYAGLSFEEYKRLKRLGILGGK